MAASCLGCAGSDRFMAASQLSAPGAPWSLPAGPPGGPAAGWPAPFRARRSVPGAGGRAPRGRSAPPGWVRLAGERLGDLLGRLRAGRPGHRHGRRRRPGRCSRCGWVGGTGTGRYSHGRRPGLRCRAGGRPPRCRPAPRRPCAPRRAKGWANRPCERLARTSPAALTASPLPSRRTAKPSSSTAVTVRGGAVDRGLPGAPQRAWSSTLSPARYSRSARPPRAGQARPAELPRGRRGGRGPGRPGPRRRCGRRPVPPTCLAP